MNSELLIIGGSDFQFMDLLSQKIKNAFPNKEIYTTHDAFQVYTRVEAKKPYLVILEMVLPQWDWDGYLLFKFLKRDTRFQNLQAVLIMDNLDETAQRIAKDPDINKLLFKIYNLDFIFEEIKKLI